MIDRRHLDRRQFLAGSTAAAATFSSVLLPRLLAQVTDAAQKIPVSTTAATDITGGIHAILEGQTTRPLRYQPDGIDFVARNGKLFFNRPVYGPISSFRVDAGDLPEFSLYLPGHGGNLKLGMAAKGGAKWFAQAAKVTARYRPGRMIYEIRDPLLDGGSVHLELLTALEGSAIMLQVRTQDVPPDVSLAWAFAGASGRKGARNGDIGCENQPITEFFQVRPEECEGNEYSIEDAKGSTRACTLHSPFCDLAFTFPAEAELAVADFSAWEAPPATGAQGVSQPAMKPRLAILTGSMPMIAGEPLYVGIRRPERVEASKPHNLQTDFAARSQQIESIATTMVMDTPDAYLGPVGPALAVAAEGLWDANLGCVMHGCVAWRAELAGWRGPYCLDSLGLHDRAKIQFRHWLKKQNTSPVTGGDAPTGPADPGTHLARKELMLHSNGDLSHNHYDMNMVFFDVLLRHLRWTGDMDFALEVWPTFERHLAWEKRMFRREFKGKDGNVLPLYEAYAAIWASDNLQYNGGGVAHSSAYNIFSFRFAAALARMLDKDPAPYQQEAALIEEAMQEHLWIPGQGCFAESKDTLGAQAVYNSPALWTVYHTIDSEVPDRRQAWQMVAERLAVLRRVPVHGAGVPAGGWYLLACSNWLPYIWSLNLIVLAENTHTALAMWQAGMADEAYLLLKGNILDSMYQGQCPGDFHMSSQLDDHRQESQRDFGDPIGITSRALVEGLYGFRPDMIQGNLAVHPGFPSDWTHASLRHPDFDYAWTLNGETETYVLASRLPRQVPLTLVLRARTTRLPVVKSGGRAVPCSFDSGAVGAPAVVVKLPAAESWSITVQWEGERPLPPSAPFAHALGDSLALPRGVTLAQIDDPQQCLKGGRIAAAGFHTVFARMRDGDCQWSLPISFQAKDPALQFPTVARVPSGAQVEPLDLSGMLKHDLNDIFKRGYVEPRSPFCSLAIPEQIQGGWSGFGTSATIDDAGLRGAGGMLQTPLGVSFRTPGAGQHNCLFLSQWAQDQPMVELPVRGRAAGAYLLLTGSTLPQASRMQHGMVTATYSDGSASNLLLRNPETWWPIEQDYFLDDYMFIDSAPLPPRVDLATGKMRLLDPANFKGKGRNVRGGAATVLYLPLDARKNLASIRVQAHLYGIVMALIAITLVRPAG